MIQYRESYFWGLVKLPPQTLEQGTSKILSISALSEYRPSYWVDEIKVISSEFIKRKQGTEKFLSESFLQGEQINEANLEASSCFGMLIGHKIVYQYVSP